MDERSPRTDGLLVVAAMVSLMWILEIVDVVAGNRLDAYGIEPRTADGLPDVVSAPFLHVGFDHLIANTIPFVLMGAAIALGGAMRVLAVTAIVGLTSGLGVWLVAPAGTVTLGASGLVFGYATYLIFRGLFNRSALEIAIGVVVGAVWGTALLGGLLPQAGVSWQGHFFGAVGGLIAARMLARRRGAPQQLSGPRVAT